MLDLMKARNTLLQRRRSYPDIHHTFQRNPRGRKEMLRTNIRPNLIRDSTSSSRSMANIGHILLLRTDPRPRPMRMLSSTIWLCSSITTLRIQLQCRMPCPHQP